jgi:branched-chain amino acid transport system substrate-binding protein
MRRITMLAAAAALGLAASAAQAQDTVKIGLIMAYSGQFADTAAQMDNAIKLFIKQNGDTVAGKKIELIRKDTGGPNPDVAKRRKPSARRASPPRPRSCLSS